MQRWKGAVGLVFLVLVRVMFPPWRLSGRMRRLLQSASITIVPTAITNPGTSGSGHRIKMGAPMNPMIEDALARWPPLNFPAARNGWGSLCAPMTWQKYVSVVRFIEEFHRGAAEIWLVSKDPTIYTAPPAELGMAQTSHEEVTVKVHYRRHDQDYTGWNLWMWVDGREGFGIEFTEEDDFGKIAVVPFTDLQDATSLGIIVRRSTATNAWAQKDVEHDRFIPLFRADEQGQIEVWLMEKDARLYYRYEDIDLDPGSFQP